MGIRQTINQNPAITIGVASLVILVALFFTFRNAFFGSGGGGVVEAKEFFSTDEGKTWFVDDATKVPPWQTDDGKTAVRVRVFKCGPSGKEFVNHMERYPEDVKAQLEAAIEEGGRGADVIALQQQMEIKRPDTGRKKHKWVAISAGNAREIAEVRTPVCPDNTGDGGPLPVPPPTE